LDISLRIRFVHRVHILSEEGHSSVICLKAISGVRSVRRFNRIALSLVLALLGAVLPAGLASGAGAALPFRPIGQLRAVFDRLPRALVCDRTHDRQQSSATAVTPLIDLSSQGACCAIGIPG
jgi:hypothetical protein